MTKQTETNRLERCKRNMAPIVQNVRNSRNLFELKTWLRFVVRYCMCKRVPIGLIIGPDDLPPISNQGAMVPGAIMSDGDLFLFQWQNELHLVPANKYFSEVHRLISKSDDELTRSQSIECLKLVRNMYYAATQSEWQMAEESLRSISVFVAMDASGLMNQFTPVEYLKTGKAA